VKSKEAINGIVNVLALGSSFLCGAFVPVEFLPKSVLMMAHILPSYWFIQNNEQISTLKHFDFVSLKPILVNFGVLLIFTILFGILTNLCTKKRLRQ